jgi:large subunit ribosomal protein L1
VAKGPAKPQIRKKPLHGKKYREAEKKIEKGKVYPLDEAIKLAKDTSYSKFVGSIELHIRLNTDPKKKEQAVRANFVLPHSTGKKVKIVVFTSKPASLKGKVEAAGGEELVEKISKGWSDFDVALATPEMMPKIAKVAKILGPKGKMPNPKSGTITDKPEEAIEEFSKGKIEIKSDAGGSVHIALGKLDMEDKSIKENLLKVVEALSSARPSGVKGNFLRSITLSASMGPGIKVAPESLT